MYQELMPVKTDESKTNQPSTSKNIEKIPSGSLCAVCNENAHGKHFGVMTCRACAAFFRRSIVHKCEYHCVRSDGNCTMAKKIRVLCKFCRYKKCQALGMKPDNIQLNRDTMSAKKIRETSQEKEQESEIISITQESPPASLQSERVPSPIVELPPILLRWAVIKEQINEMIQTEGFILGTSPSGNRPILSNLEDSVVRRSPFKDGIPKITTFITGEDCIRSWECERTRNADFMLSCEGFTQLSPSQRLILFQGNRGPINRLGRYYASVNLFGERVITEMLLVLADGTCAYMNELQADLSLLTNHSLKDIREMFSPFVNQALDNLVKPMLDLRVTQTEYVYILGQLMWHVEDLDGIEQETIRIADSVRTRLSGEIHLYYTKEMHMTNYADRLSRIMDIAHTLKGIHSASREVIDLAKMFGVFKLEICDTTRDLLGK